ncbi:MAG: aminoacyl-tRNA hydrolase [Candidatus Berkelbacteria bacterium]|nr:MAG: aminoacyl-tRNA hydrolase [Candidatus Berkelbacteria bacterium]QQG51442.1 MAG: aminoacyl-tRNA hydrolase [Candidatus Berkelbacteria bacterium]
MKAIIGLGNPGRKYDRTRHNIGFRIVEALVHKLHGEFNEGGYIPAQYFKSGDVEILKPLTYVNESGVVANKIKQKHGLDHEDIWVIHDDVEIPFGEVRVKLGGSSGGHNGIKSIDEAIGPEYWRIRVGVGRDAKFVELADYVLAPFTEEEEKELGSVIDRVVSYLIQSIDEQNLSAITFNAKEKHQDSTGR